MDYDKASRRRQARTRPARARTNIARTHAHRALRTNALMHAGAHERCVANVAAGRRQLACHDAQARGGGKEATKGGGNGGVGSAGRRVSGDCVGGCRTVGGRALGFHFVMLANVLLASSLSSSSSSSLLNGVRNECVCVGGVHSGCQIRFSGDRREEVHKVRTGRPEEPKHMPKPYCGLRRLPPAHTRACTCTHAHAHARAHMHAHANSRTPTTYTHTHTPRWLTRASPSS